MEKYMFKFSSRKEATEFVNRVRYAIETYGMISCTDARELAGILARSANEGNIGWVDIDGVKISHIPHKYVVTMPRAIYLGPSEKMNNDYKHCVPTFVCNSRGEAEKILDEMTEILHKYGRVSMHDLHELGGVSTSSSYRYHRNGWINLDSSYVEKLHPSGQYAIYLPHPIPLNVDVPDYERTPSKILDILKSIFRAEKYTYVILGKPGPTGKTWLQHELKKMGFNAVEISTDTYELITYNDNRNHVTIDDINHQVVIVLNQELGRNNK